MKTKTIKKLSKKEVVNKYNSEKNSEYFLLDEDYGQDVEYRVTVNVGSRMGYYDAAGDYNEE